MTVLATPRDRATVIPAVLEQDCIPGARSLRPDSLLLCAWSESDDEAVVGAHRKRPTCALDPATN